MEREDEDNEIGCKCGCMCSCQAGAPCTCTRGQEKPERARKKAPCAKCVASDRRIDQLEAEKRELLDGLKQMICAFDNPIARRKMPDQWSEDSRDFSREIYERITIK